MGDQPKVSSFMLVSGIAFIDQVEIDDLNLPSATACLAISLSVSVRDTLLRKPRMCHTSNFKPDRTPSKYLQ